MSKPSSDGASSLRFLTQSQIKPYLPDSARGFASIPSEMASSDTKGNDEKELDKAQKDLEKRYQAARLPTTLPPLVFLGIDDRVPEGTKAEDNPKDPKGVAYFALECVDGLKGNEVEGQFTEPRLAGSLLGGWEANLFAQARALMGKCSYDTLTRSSLLSSLSCIAIKLADLNHMTDWNNRYKFCPGCGSPTYSLWCGWKRGCGSIVGEGRDGHGSERGKVCPST